jgi:hypothetical protein
MFHFVQAGASPVFAARLIIKHTRIAKLNATDIGQRLGITDKVLKDGIGKHTYDIGRTFLGLRKDPTVMADLAELRNLGGIYRPVPIGGIRDIQGDLNYLLSDRKWSKESFHAKVHEIEQKVTSFTNHVEMTTRLAVFRTLRDAGMDPVLAAHWAQDLTGNFAVKGLATQTLASAYPFYNAGVQSDNATLSTFLKAGARKTIKAGAGLFALGAIVGLYNYWMGDMHKDEEGNNPYSLMPAYKRRGTSLAVAMPFYHGENGDQNYYFKDPIPFRMAGMFINAGNDTIAMMHGDLEPLEMAKDYVTEIFSSGAHWTSNPANNPIVGITPGVLRIPASLAINKTGLGGPIHPEFPLPTDTPKSQIYSKHASDVSIALSNAMHKAGIYEQYPDDTDFIVSELVGSSGKFFTGIIGAGYNFLNPKATEERETRGQNRFDPLVDNPVSGIFTNKLTSSDVANRFYIASESIKKFEEKYNEAELGGDLEEMMRLSSQYPKESAMLGQYQETIGLIKSNHSELKLVKNNPEMSNADKITQARSLNNQVELAQRQFYYMWHHDGQYPPERAVDPQ